MIKTAHTGLGALVAAGLCAMGGIAVADDATDGLERIRFKIGGERQEVWLFEAAKGPRPVVMVLREPGASLAGQRALGFEAEAKANGFHVLYTDTANLLEGPGAETGDAGTVPLPGPGTLSLITAELTEEEHLTPGQLYLTGLGAAGAVALEAACTIADRLAGVAVVATSLPAGEPACAPAKPLPFLMIAPTGQNITPFNGGDTLDPLTGTKNGEVLSARQTMEIWWAANGCTENARVRAPDAAQADETDGSTVVFIERTCEKGVRTFLYVVEGGGYRWPGQPVSDDEPAETAKRLGRINRDISGPATVASFFSHTMRPAKD